MQKLNLGAGKDRKEGYVNIDWNPLDNPDILHDLNVFPYPFAEATFDLIEANHIMEHLDRPFAVMKELHRILKPEGKLIINVPHFSRGFSHSEHAHGFDTTFPLYFDKNFPGTGYFGVDFKIESMRFQYFAFLHLLPYLGFSRFTIVILKGVNAIVSFLANLSPYFTSRIWCYWVGGFEQITFVFIGK